MLKSALQFVVEKKCIRFHFLDKSSVEQLLMFVICILKEDFIGHWSS